MGCPRAGAGICMGRGLRCHCFAWDGGTSLTSWFQEGFIHPKQEKIAKEQSWAALSAGFSAWSGYGYQHPNTNISIPVSASPSSPTAGSILRPLEVESSSLISTFVAK